MTFLEKWIEHDYNPFIIFKSDGKVASLNQEAQFLIGEANTKEIFELAKAYANITYGFKTTLLDLEFGKYRFYAITVGYENEDEIGIKLYKKETKKFSSIKEYGESVNIYAILDLCISVASTNNDIKFKKEFDPTFPNLRLNIEGFTKLLNKIYHLYRNSKRVTTKLFLKTGEYIKFEDKKFPIFTIEISAESKEATNEKAIEEIADKINCIVTFKDKSVSISSPLVL